MFGGFDGEFYNDLHALHLNELIKHASIVGHSTFDKDLSNLIDNPEHSDFIISVSVVNDKVTSNGEMNSEQSIFVSNRDFHVCKPLMI